MSQLTSRQRQEAGSEGVSGRHGNRLHSPNRHFHRKSEQSPDVAILPTRFNELNQGYPWLSDGESPIPNFGYSLRAPVFSPLSGVAVIVGVVVTVPVCVGVTVIVPVWVTVGVVEGAEG